MKICYYQLESVDSTNSWAKRKIASNALNIDANTLIVVSADCQTAGRGRWSRNWSSPAKKNAYITLVLPCTAPVFCFSQLTTVVLQELLNEFSINAAIKWPNDLLVNGKKISGILLETFNEYMVIGIGLNINMSQEELNEVSQAATSMALETSKQYDVQKIIQKLINCFIDHYQKASLTDFTSVINSWHKKVQWMILQPVSVQTASGKIAGTLTALKENGSVIVQIPCGKNIAIQSIDTIEL